MTKYIFISGNMLGFNKSIFISCIGALLKENNLKINIKKISNTTPVRTFVTSDGCELDLDLGYYERITEIITNSDNNIILSNKHNIINFIELNAKEYDIILIDITDINIIKYFVEMYGKYSVINIHFSPTQKDFIPDIIINTNNYYQIINSNIYKIRCASLQLQLGDA